MASAENASAETTTSTTILLRFFLVRHGLAQANVEGLVAGQNDTPLTPTGVLQAQALGRTLRNVYFWRVYASDLSRAHTTCQSILQTADAAAATTAVVLDTRLRELSKGARETFPKAWSEERARHERERQGETEMPALEPAEHGWERMWEWWNQVVADAIRTARRSSSSTTTDNDEQKEREQAVEVSSDNPGSISDTDNPGSISDNNDINHRKVVRNVLAVSHSGILRVFLQRLLGKERLQAHPNAQYDKDRFLVPNTSVTILELEVSSKEENEEVTLIVPGSDRIRIRKLTDTAHYATMADANSVTLDSRR